MTGTIVELELPAHLAARQLHRANMGIHRLTRRGRRLSAGKVSPRSDRRVVDRGAKSGEQSTAECHAYLEMECLRGRASGSGGAVPPYEHFGTDERVTCRAHRSVGRRIGHAASVDPARYAGVTR